MAMKIRKYLAMAKASLQTSFVYRVDSLLWGTGELIDTLVFCSSGLRFSAKIKLWPALLCRRRSLI